MIYSYRQTSITYIYFFGVNSFFTYTFLSPWRTYARPFESFMTWRCLEFTFPVSVKGLLALPEDSLGGESFFPVVTMTTGSFLISLRSLGSKSGRSTLDGALPLRRATWEGDLLGAEPKRSRPPGEYLGAALPDILVGDGDLLDLGDDEDLGEDLGVSGDNCISPVVGDLAAVGDLCSLDDATSTNTGLPHWKFSLEWNKSLKILQSTAIAFNNLSVCATGAFLLTASAKT